jgi:hypothetical protein
LIQNKFKFHHSLLDLIDKINNAFSQLDYSNLKLYYNELELSKEFPYLNEDCYMDLLNSLIILNKSLIIKYDNCDFSLELIIGTILKMRVAIISIVYMKQFGLNGESDKEFNQYFPGLSKRTPDFIIKDEEKSITFIIETSYSSKKVKGLYSKGVSKETSKYYDEIFLIESRTKFEVIYIPLIFFDNLDKEENNEFYKFFLQQEKVLKDYFPYKSLDIYKKCLDLSYELNREVYDRGSTMNICFNLIKRKPEINSMTRFKIVEFNYNMLIYLNPSINAFPRRVIELIFSKSLIDCSEEDFKLFQSWVKLMKLKKYKNISNIIIRDTLMLFSHDVDGYSMEVNKRSREDFLRDNYWSMVGDLNSVIKRSKDVKKESERNLITKKLTIMGPMTSVYTSKTWKPLDPNIERPNLNNIITQQLSEMNLNFKAVSNVNINEVKLLNGIESEDIFSCSVLKMIKGQLSVQIKISLSDIEELIKILKKDISLLINLPYLEFTKEEPNIRDSQISKYIIQPKNKLITHNFSRRECVISDENEVRYIVDFSHLNIKVRSYREIVKPSLVDYERLERVPINNDNLEIFENVKLIEPVKSEFMESIFDSIRRYNKSINDCDFLYTKKTSKFDVNIFKDTVQSLSELSNSVPYDSVCQKSYLVTREYKPETLNQFIDKISDSYEIDAQRNIDSIIKNSEKNDYYIGPYEIANRKVYLNSIEIDLKECSQDLIKYINNIILINYNDNVKNVIDWCDRMKLTKENKDRKKYIGWNDDIINYEDKYNTFNDIQDQDIYYEFSLTEYLINQTVGCIKQKCKEEFEKLKKVLMCEEVRILYALSKIHKSILQTCLKVPVKKGRAIVINSGFKGIFALIIKSKKIANDKVQVRYILFRNMEFDKESVFKNKINDNLFCTNVYQSSIKELEYKSNLFFNLIPFIVNKLNYPTEDLRRWLCKTYTLFYRTSKTVKMIISIFKYLNVIQFSDFSNPNNLMKKYLLSHPYKNKDQLLFAFNIVQNFNLNLDEVTKLTLEDMEQFDSIRFKEINLKLKSCLSYEDNIAEFISSNGVYQLVYKDVTSDITNYAEFINTIISNNNKVTRIPLKDINTYHPPTEDYKPAFYDEKILRNSIDLLFEKLKSSHGRNFNRLTSYEFIKEEFEKYIDNNFSKDFSNDHKSLNYNLLDLAKEIAESKDNNSIRTSRLKSQLNDSLFELVKDMFNTKEEVSPILLFNKFFSIISDPNHHLHNKFINLSNLSIVTKKSQHEGDREIYIVSIISKILLYIIQIFYRNVNLIIPEEMVVKSVGTKLHEIKKMTERISRVPKDYEIIYFNGDMQAWSGTDIYQKFYCVTDQLKKFYPENIINMVLNCLKLTEQMKIIIPFEVQSMFSDESETFHHLQVIKYERSWGQGLYHNISSFVHILEQNFRKVCLNYELLVSENIVERKFTIEPLSTIELENKDITKTDIDENDAYSSTDKFYDFWVSNKDFQPDRDRLPFVSDYKFEMLKEFFIIGDETETQLKINYRLNSLRHHPDKTGLPASNNFKDYLSLKSYIMDNLRLLVKSSSIKEFFLNLAKEIDLEDSFREINKDSDGIDYEGRPIDNPITLTLRSYGNNNQIIKRWSQIAHSDDKNEIVAIKLKYYEKFVKFANIGPLFFSLKPSPNKDSFSRVVSEMVGLQNIRGSLYDNPNKTMNDWMTNIDRPDFIKTYKDTLSRLENYLWKSCDNVGTQLLNYLSYSSLYIKFGLLKVGIDPILLPVEYGGCYLGPLKSLEYGYNSDIVQKDIIYQSKGFGYDINKLRSEEFVLVLRNSKSLRGKIQNYLKKSSIEINQEDLQDLKNREIRENYLNNLVNTVAKIRKTYINRPSTVYKEKLITYFKTERFRQLDNSFLRKTFRDVLSHYLSLYTNNYSGKEINYIPREVVLETIRDIKLSYNERNHHSHFLDMKNFNIKLEKIDTGHMLLSVDTIRDLFYHRYEKLFNNNQMRSKKNIVIDLFLEIADKFELSTIEDFEKRKQEIINLNSSRKRSKLYIFKGFTQTDWKYESERIYSEESSSLDLYREDLMVKYRQILNQSIKNCEDYFKENINNYLIAYDFRFLDRIKDYVLNNNINLNLLMKTIKDESILSILTVIFDISIKEFKFDSTIIRNLSLVLITSTDEYSFYKIVSEGTLVDILVKTKDYSYTFKNKSSHYRLLISDKRLQSMNLSDNIDLLSDMVNPVYQFLNLNGVFIELNFNPLSKANKKIGQEKLREKIMIKLDEYQETISDLSKNVVIIRTGNKVKTVVIEFFTDHKNFEILSDNYSRLEYSSDYILKVNYDKSSGNLAKPKPHKYSLDISHSMKKQIGYLFKKSLILMCDDRFDVGFLKSLSVTSSMIDMKLPYVYLNKVYNINSSYDKLLEKSELHFLRSLTPKQRNTLSLLLNREKSETFKPLDFELLSNRNRFAFTNRLVNGMNMRIKKSISRHHVHTFLRSIHYQLESKNYNNLNEQDKRLVIAFYNSLEFVVSRIKNLNQTDLPELKFDFLLEELLEYLKTNRTKNNNLYVLIMSHIDCEFESYRIENSVLKTIDEEVFDNLIDFESLKLTMGLDTKSLEKELNSQNSQIRDLKDQLEKGKTELLNRANQDILNKMQDRMLSIEEDVKNLKSQNESLSLENLELKAIVNNLKKENEELIRRSENHKCSSDDNDEARIFLEQQLELSNQELYKVKQDIIKLNLESIRQKNKEKVIQQEKEEIEKKLDNHWNEKFKVNMEETKDLKNSIDTIKQKNEELVNKLDQKDIEIDTLKERTSVLANQFENLRLDDNNKKETKRNINELQIKDIDDEDKFEDHKIINEELISGDYNALIRYNETVNLQDTILKRVDEYNKQINEIYEIISPKFNHNNTWKQIYSITNEDLKKIQKAKQYIKTNKINNYVFNYVKSIIFCYLYEYDGELPKVPRITDIRKLKDYISGDLLKYVRSKNPEVDYDNDVRNMDYICDHYGMKKLKGFREPTNSVDLYNEKVDFEVTPLMKNKLNGVFRRNFEGKLEENDIRYSSYTKGEIIGLMKPKYFRLHENLNGRDRIEKLYKISDQDTEKKDFANTLKQYIVNHLQRDDKETTLNALNNKISELSSLHEGNLNSLNYDEMIELTNVCKLSLIFLIKDNENVKLADQDFEDVYICEVSPNGFSYFEKKKINENNLVEKARVSRFTHMFSGWYSGPPINACAKPYTSYKKVDRKDTLQVLYNNQETMGYIVKWANEEKKDELIFYKNE